MGVSASISRVNPRKAALGLLLATVIVVLITAGVYDYLSLAGLKRFHGEVVAWYGRYPVAAPVAFVCIYLVGTGLALHVSTVLTLGAGAVFGWPLGALLSVVGSAGGATIAMAASRYLFREGVERLLGERAADLRETFARDGFIYLLLLRVIPLMPFDAVNLGCGLTRIPLGVYAGTTLAGMVPHAFIVSYAGTYLANIETMADVFSAQGGLVVLLMAAPMLIAAAVVMRRRRKAATNGPPN